MAAALPPRMAPFQRRLRSFPSLSSPHPFPSSLSRAAALGRPARNSAAARAARERIRQVAARLARQIRQRRSASHDSSSPLYAAAAGHEGDTTEDEEEAEDAGAALSPSPHRAASFSPSFSPSPSPAAVPSPQPPARRFLLGSPSLNVEEFEDPEDSEGGSDIEAFERKYQAESPSLEGPAAASSAAARSPPLPPLPRRRRARHGDASPSVTARLTTLSSAMPAAAALRATATSVAAAEEADEVTITGSRITRRSPREHRPPARLGQSRADFVSMLVRQVQRQRGEPLSRIRRRTQLIRSMAADPHIPNQRLLDALTRRDAFSARTETPAPPTPSPAAASFSPPPARSARSTRSSSSAAAAEPLPAGMTIRRGVLAIPPFP
jgi:hypothetical protein